MTWFRDQAVVDKGREEFQKLVGHKNTKREKRTYIQAENECNMLKWSESRFCFNDLTQLNYI
jgi:hypothetical protein